MTPSAPNPPNPYPFRQEDLAEVTRFVADIPVDEATVWLITPEGDALEAIFNPVNDKLPGLRQPLSRGLISQVFATGLPLLERDVSRRSGHDPSIDSHTGLITEAMLAAPIAAEDRIIGVISAVRLAGSRYARDIDKTDLTRLQRLARRLGMASSVSRETDPTTD
jgi:GAF domain-containing protein